MESTPPRPRIDQQRTHERPHVLVVSDDRDLSEFLSQGLPLGGFWVSVIASGLQALEVFRLRQFDMVVVDAEMQSFDAIEFLRRLRGLSELGHPGHKRTEAPVIVLSTTPAPSDAFPSNLDVWQVLQAPLELEDLVRILHEAFAVWRGDHPDAPLADSANLVR